MAPDPTLAGSRRPTSIDAHAHPQPSDISRVQIPSFSGPSSHPRPPETATLRPCSNFSTSHDTRKNQCHPPPALPPAYRQCQPQTHSRSIPPPIVPLPKPPAIGPRHFCPPLPRKRSTPSGTWRPPSRIPNPEPPPPSRLRPHTRTPPSAIPPPSKSPFLPALRPDCIPSRIGPRPPAKCAQCHPRRLPSRRGDWSPSLRVGCSTPSRKGAQAGLGRWEFSLSVDYVRKQQGGMMGRGR